MKMRRPKLKAPSKRQLLMAGIAIVLALGELSAMAQDANAGIIGAVKVYQKWNAGDPDTSKVAAAWFGSCVFLVVVATVIKSFFGL